MPQTRSGQVPDTRHILAVTDFFPWPPRNGGLLRTSTAVEALADVGVVDIFSLRDLREPEPALPENLRAGRLRAGRLGTAAYPAVDGSGRWRYPWLVQGGARSVPMEVAMRRRDGTPRRALQSWLAGGPSRYDLVWFSRATIFEWLGRPRLGPTVVDLHDLESDKERRRAALMAGSAGDVVSRARSSLARAQARLNARRWAAFESSVAESVDAVVLASQADARRSDLPHLSVVDNTYRRPARPSGRPEPVTPPTLLFQGTFDYGPNVDGARWLVEEVGPRVRARMPGTAIRLVGRTTKAVEELHDPPDVTVVGQVPEMEPELARADVAVVPVRYASGTRFKILESFAHRVPVVSTTVGAEGLDVEHGVHLLVADTPDEFAEACRRLTDDRLLRRAIVTAAEEQFVARYEVHVARQQVATLAGRLIGVGTGPR